MTDYIKASEYCESVFDGTHDTPSPSKEGKPLLTSKNILGGRLDLSGAYNISLSDYQKIQKRSAVSQWDVLFSMIGSVGEVYLETSEIVDYAIKNVGVFSTKDEHKARWLYLYLTSPYAKKTIENYMTGAVQKFLGLGVLRDFPVLPYDETKRPIINLVSSIDDKIELNRKINAELEQMARTLYDYWFVQFDFPDANGKPYKSSGGAMKFSPELNREIPAGWRIASLYEISEIYQPKILSAKDLSSDGEYPVYGSNGIIGRYHSYNHDQSEVVVSCRGDCGNIHRTPPKTWITGNAMVFKPRSELKMHNEFLCQALRYVGLKQISTGSVQGQITRTNVEGLGVVLPDEKTLSVFNSFAEPIVAKKLLNNEESQKLAELRDWLLPMLMNGQVKVV